MNQNMGRSAEHPDDGSAVAAIPFPYPDHVSYMIGGRCRCAAYRPLKIDS